MNKEVQAKVKAARKQKLKRFLARFFTMAVFAGIGYLAVSWHLREQEQAQQTSVYRAMDLQLKMMQLRACMDPSKGLN